MNQRRFYHLIDSKKLPAWWPASRISLPARCTWLSMGLTLATGLLLVNSTTLARADDTAPASRQLPRIEAGTWVAPATPADQTAGRWNRIVLLARPRIASGDVDALSAAVRGSVSKFVLTIMASVDRTTDLQSGEPRFRLVEVGMAYSTEVEGQLMTVTVATAERLGVELGFLPRMLLAENEQQLKTAFIVARTSTLMIFDVPAQMQRGLEHIPYLMRHMVWIDPRSGRSSTLIWLIRRSTTGQDEVEQAEPARYIPPGFREDRAIHVDGSQFNILGIPNKKAFALESLPAGKSIDWSPDALELAGLRSFDVDSLRQLSTALNAMLQTVRSSATDAAEQKPD